MTVPTGNPETLMAHPNSESLQQSKDTNSPRSMEVLQHVLQKILDIKDEEENKSFSKWIRKGDMTALLKSVLISVTSWTGSMTTVSSEQMA